MKMVGKSILIVTVIASLAGCVETRRDKTVIIDRGPDGGPLINGLATIWVDPDGCQHWYIDDGVEGFMTPRLKRDGTPRCGDDTAIIAKDGTVISDD